VQGRLKRADDALADHRFLSPARARRTSRLVASLFDMKLRAIRRNRAARSGPELFLLERVFDECLERVTLVERRFERALLIGCPDSGWPERLKAVAGEVEVRDPGPLFAAAAGGDTIIEDAWEPPAQRFDLVLALGTLDTVDDLPVALRLVRHAVRDDGLFIGALSGGETLPRLRAAMRAADAVAGAAAPHVHPRVEASSLAALLAAAGFARPVVDIDRIQVTYRYFGRLVADLRAMAATNLMRQRPARLSREAREAAAAAFAEAGDDGRTIETFEILHFAAWAPTG
jgi:SAM-dependent methyltransferase